MSTPLTEERIRRIVGAVVSKNNASIQNILNQGVSTSQQAKEADHAASADEARHAASSAALDDDSAVWDKLKTLFLSKTDDDTAAGIITFLKGLVAKGDSSFENFIASGTAEVGGDANLKGNVTIGKDASVSGKATAATAEVTGKATMGSAEVSGAADLKGGITIGPNGSYSITKEGVAKLAGAVAEYLKSSDFSAGTGKGFDGTGYGITKDAAGKYTLEIDNIIARIKWVAAVLEVHEMTFIGGMVVMSPCGNRIDLVEALDASGNVITDGSTPDKFRCYFLATDGENSIKNEWAIGQLARCQTNNLSKGTFTDYENRDYWRLVVGVSSEPVAKSGKTYHYIDLSNSSAEQITLTDGSGTQHIVKIGGVDKNNTSAPLPNDKVVGMGHQWDTDRQDVAILSASGWTLYKGIDHYELPYNNIINKFGIDEAVVRTDHLKLIPYAQSTDVQTALCVRGEYSATASYGHNDVVTYGGQSWVCAVKIGDTCKGQTPSATSAYWTLFVAKGATGPQGEKGEKGEDGNGVNSITNYYLATSASTGVTTSTSGWTPNVQAITETNKYLWNYEVIAYTKSTALTTTPHIIGRYGDTGNGIKSVTEYYALSANTAKPAQSAFSTNVPVLTATNKYLWNYEVVAYTSGSSVNTYDKARIIGVYGDKGATGSSLVTLITDYTYNQSAINAYSKDGYSGTWAVQSTAGAKVGDTVLLRVTNTSKGGYSFIIAKITAIPSSTSVTCTSNGLIDKGDQGIPGDKGDGYAISFLLNGVPVDVINFDTVKGLSNVASFEADLTNNGAACNANRATLTCYDAEGNVLGSPIDVTDTNAVVADGGNLYLSRDCKNITAQFYGAKNVLLKEKSVAVMRDTQMYALKQLNTTRATVKASDSTTGATFALDAELHFQVVKNTGGNTENPTITSIKATAGSETFSNSAVNNIEAALTCNGTVAYNATNRPPSTIQVEIVCEGKTLYATVPVTMEAGVAIDINKNLATVTSTAMDNKGNISTLQQTASSLSLKVQDLQNGGIDTGKPHTSSQVDFTTLSSDNFYPVMIKFKNDDGVRHTVEIDRPLNAAYGSGKGYMAHGHGFSFRLVFSDIANAWGSYEDGQLRIESISQRWTTPADTPICPKIAQYYPFSFMLAWLRGGSKYDVTVDCTDAYISGIWPYMMQVASDPSWVPDAVRLANDTWTTAQINAQAGNPYNLLKKDGGGYYSDTSNEYLYRFGKLTAGNTFAIIGQPRDSKQWFMATWHITNVSGSKVYVDTSTYGLTWQAQNPLGIRMNGMLGYIKTGESYAKSKWDSQDGFGSSVNVDNTAVHADWFTTRAILVIGTESGTGRDRAVLEAVQSCTKGNSVSFSSGTFFDLSPLYGTDGRVNVKSDLLATGIDIDSKKVTMTGQQFLWKNNRGATVAYMDDGGNAHFEGIINASGGNFTGTISAATISGGTINGATINGSTINSKNGTSTTTIAGGKITTNNLIANGGSIGGFNISQDQIGSDSTNGEDVYVQHNEMSLFKNYIYFNSPHRRTLLGCLTSLGSEMMASLKSQSFNTIPDYGIVAGIFNYANFGFGSNAVALHLNGCIEGLAVQTEVVSRGCTIGKYTGSFVILGAGTDYYLPDMEPWDEGHEVKIKRLAPNINVKPQDDWTIILNAGKYNEYRDEIYLGKEATNPVAASAKNVGYSVTDYDKVTWQVVEKEGMKLFHHSWQTYMSVDAGLVQTDLGIQSPGDAMTFVFHGALTTTKLANCKGCWVQYKHPRDW